ncbi:MAG: hypothetical protein GQ573_01405 [Gammaproteobacteria bacterium]|nr:hypothetical protein [Gammaproteobacteria bacterium]
MNLDDNKWAISTLLAVLALVIPIMLYLVSLPDKSLTYQIISKSELIGTNISVDDLVIKIKDQPIKEAYIYLIKILNEGAEPITKNDFERPMFLRFVDGTKIFHVKFKNKKPDNLSLTYAIEENVISINPFLFNPADEFDIEILSSSDTRPAIDARIAGITNVDELLPTGDSNTRKIITLLLTFSLLVFYSKHARLVVSSSGNLNETKQKIINALLSITCAFSSVSLLRSVLDIDDNKALVLGAMIIPATLGMFLAKSEIKYNKSLNLTGTENAPPS